ncbi:MAG: beta-ketoacyl synthase N-terminal-like domain-containing protein, partial [Pseudomonadota bacterium]
MSIHIQNRQIQYRQDDQQGDIVITGMGIVSPIGESVDEVRQSLEAGRSGITRWKEMDEGSYSQIGGDLSDFDLKGHLARIGANYPDDMMKRARKLLRTTPLSGRLTACAALQ